MATVNNISVAVRVRPFLPLETGTKSCIEVLQTTCDDQHQEGNDNSISNGTNTSRPTAVRLSLAQRRTQLQDEHDDPTNKSNSHTFTFDYCFPPSTSQSQLYATLVGPLLTSCLEGFHVTCLAYGQTGSGKTYTTLGPATSPDFFYNNNKDNKPPQPQHYSQEYDAVGILPRALRDLFYKLDLKKETIWKSNQNKEEDTNSTCCTNNNTEISTSNKLTRPPAYEYQVQLQFLEVYGEEIRDLLSTTTANNNNNNNNNNNYNNNSSNPSYSVQKIVIRDSPTDTEVLGATTVPVFSAQEAMLCLTRGMLRRVTGATAMNAESSRSHAIMTVLVEQVTRTFGEHEIGEEDTNNTPSMNAVLAGNSTVVVSRSKFNFVDLAGSERQKRTNAKGQRLKEGIDINKGLLVLGNVISALASREKAKFVPYRDSKLTRLLRGSLGGNHKTLMIACASPSIKNAEESLNCLRYANRAKNIQNLAVVNVDPHSKLVNVLMKQVEALAGELLRLSTARGMNGGKVDNDRFSLDLLQTLVRGGKEALAISIKEKRLEGKETTTLSSNSTNVSVRISPTVEELTVELERTRHALKETQTELAEKVEQLEAVVADRDNLRHSSEAMLLGATPAKAPFITATPSKARGIMHGESIREILTSLSTLDDNASDVLMLSPEVRDTFPISPQGDITSKEKELTMTAAKLDNAQIEILTSEVQTLRDALEKSNSALHNKDIALESTQEELQTALEEKEFFQERLRNTPDIDEDTIHQIVRQIISYNYQKMDDFPAEEDEIEEESVSSTITLSPEEEQGRQIKQEELSIFASVMFSTGKFLVDRELFQDSIPCFEMVLEVRRQLYGWDDPLVGDALHMEGFVRSKMDDYDRALMLLWDALRIRKISSEPLKISATLRLLADLHFSKEENMHAALFYEECARHLKEYDMRDPHLPLILIDLARTKDRLGEYKESINFFEEALTLYEHSLDHDDDRIASLQYELGVLAFQIGDRDRGETCFRQFIRIRKSKGRDSEEGVANALFVLGSLHWATKKRDLAQDCWTEALEIFVALGRTEDDPYVKSLKEKIQRAQKRSLGRLFRGQ